MAAVVQHEAETRFRLGRLRSTPAIMRSWSVVTAVVIGVAALLSFLASQERVTATDRLEDNVAPVLIESQGLVASLAEADAASTSVFLSGIDEDRQQRRLYELAVERAPRQLEAVSSLIGDDPTAHDALADVGSRLSTYISTVEQARAANLQQDASAAAIHAGAIELVSGPSGMLASVAVIDQRAQTDFQTLDDAGDTLMIVAFVGLAAAIIVLFLGHSWLSQRTNRLLNPAMLVGAAILIALAIWMALTWTTRSRDLAEADQNAYASIAVTSELQTAAFDLKVRTEGNLIGTDAIDPAEAEAAQALIDERLRQLEVLADTPREQAAVEILAARWDRYAATSTSIISDARSGSLDTAIATSIGDGNRDFNGFNTAVESVLSDNRDQFFDAAARAAQRLAWLRLGAVILPILAIALVLWGWQVRINEYW